MSRFIFVLGSILLSLVFQVGAFAQTGISIVPPEVALAAPVGSNSAARTSISIVSRNPSVPFSVSFRHLDSATGWLSLSPSSGTTPATVVVTANPTGLQRGTYSAQIVVQGGGTAGVASVLFAVGADTDSRFVADPTGVTFIGIPGLITLEPKFVSITSRPPGSSVGFRAVATSAGNWLSVNPFPGTAPTSLRLDVSQAGLQEGIHRGSVSIIPLTGGAPTIIPVTLVAVGTNTIQPTLVLAQTIVSFNHQYGSATIPSLQAVPVGSPSGVREYTVSTTTPWLRVLTMLNPSPSTSATGYAPGDFSIEANPAGLAPGQYVGTVSVASAGLVTQQLTVVLRVLTTPVLNAAPSSVVLSNTTTLESNVTITSSGAPGGVSFISSVVSQTPWLSVTPTQGSTAAGSQLLRIAANIQGLAAGTYEGEVSLVPAGASGLTIPVQLTVTGLGGDAGVLSYSPANLDLSGIRGTTGPSATIDVLPSLATFVHPFTVATSSAGGWLVAEPTVGAAPGTIKVTANPDATSGPGIHDGAVIITSLRSGVQDRVPVRFKVEQRVLTAEPTQLTFTQDKRGVSPDAQLLRISSNTPMPISITASQEWIKVEPRTAFTPMTLSVWADVSALPAGSHSGTIRISGSNSEITVAVSISILAASMPTAAPEAVNISYQLGNPAPALPSIEIGSTAESLEFTAEVTTSSGVRWLNVSPPSGSTPSKLTATVDVNLLVPGRQVGSISVTSTSPSGVPGTGKIARTIPVTIAVNASTVIPQQVLHAASLEPTAVAPGQIVSIVGTGLGPDVGVAARPTAAGAIESRLGDVRVLFDGVAAPLLYVSKDQINAIVPYALNGRLSTKIQIEFGGNFSIPIEAKVVDAAPGIFTTASGGGRGQAAALNSDATVNSMANPAARGSVVVLFGTGEGQTDPQGQDGRIILTDLRKPRLPVTATIAGRAVQVLYAGSAPTQVSGMFQANLQIPEDLEPGLYPVQLQVGGFSTQPGVTVAVR